MLSSTSDVVSLAPVGFLQPECGGVLLALNLDCVASRPKPVRMDTLLVQTPAILCFCGELHLGTPFVLAGREIILADYWLRKRTEDTEPSQQSRLTKHWSLAVWDTNTRRSFLPESGVAAW